MATSPPCSSQSSSEREKAGVMLMLKPPYAGEIGRGVARPARGPRRWTRNIVTGGAVPGRHAHLLHLEAVGIDVGLDPAPERLLVGLEIEPVDARRHRVRREAVEQLVAVRLRRRDRTGCPASGARPRGAGRRRGRRAAGGRWPARGSSRASRSASDAHAFEHRIRPRRHQLPPVPPRGARGIDFVEPVGRGIEVGPQEQPAVRDLALERRRQALGHRHQRGRDHRRPRVCRSPRYRSVWSKVRETWMTQPAPVGREAHARPVLLLGGLKTSGSVSGSSPRRWK